jgi:hypothetical protein
VPCWTATGAGLQPRAAADPIAETLVARGSPFVFSTGYGALPMPESVKRAPLLKKPFQQKDLERALLAALRQRQ